MHGIFVMIEYHGLQIEKYGLILNTTDTACHKDISRRIRSVDMTRFAFADFPSALVIFQGRHR